MDRTVHRRGDPPCAAKDKAGVVVSPIAFVSEHVETLVELDNEYAQLAKRLQLPFYLRAPPLARRRASSTPWPTAERALARRVSCNRNRGGRLCPAACGLCAQGGAALMEHLIGYDLRAGCTSSR